VHVGLSDRVAESSDQLSHGKRSGLTGSPCMWLFVPSGDLHAKGRALHVGR
jgi:hypothetical protein